MHSSAGTRAAWGLTWLTTDITLPPFMAGGTEGVMVIQAEKCQSPDPVRVCPSTRPFLSLFLMSSFSRIQSLEKFCAFLDYCRFAAWFGSERSITEAEGQQQCWFNEVTVSHSRKLHISLLKHTHSRNTSHRYIKPGDTHTHTHTHTHTQRLGTQKSLGSLYMLTATVDRD